MLHATCYMHHATCYIITTNDAITYTNTKALMSDARHPEVRAFSLLICLDAAKFVLLSVFTLTSLV